MLVIVSNFFMLGKIWVILCMLDEPFGVWLMQYD